MTIQVTIIGIGQIGASIGLALADHQKMLLRVGHDKQIRNARQAEKMGALDRVDTNLPSSVRQADLVLLTLPMDQIHDTLSIIGEDLKEGAVVMDTAPVKEVVAVWAAEFLPKDRYYVGLTPVLNAEYLHEAGGGLEAAHADLFRGGLMGIAAPQSANSDVVKLAVDLTGLLGASPFFVDLLEIDGLMAYTHILPQLWAAALLDATTAQPGWREARKVAGRAYAEVTAPMAHLDSANALKDALLLNRQNVLRVLDETILTLRALRSDIEAQNGNSLSVRLEQARQSRERWWKERQSADWVSESMPKFEMPENPGLLGRLFGTFGRKPKQKE